MTVQSQNYGGCWLYSVTKLWRLLVVQCYKTMEGVGCTVVSTRTFHLCDPGSIPAQCCYQIKIPSWLHVWECFQFDSIKHRRFSPGTPVSSCTNTGPMRDGPYWTSRENSLVMTDRVIQYKYKVSLVFDYDPSF